MTSRALITPIALLSFAVGALHLLAIKFYLYWMFSWFDAIVHGMAGALVALLVFWFLFAARVAPGIPNTNVAFLLSVLVATMIIGVSWELFEYSINAFRAMNYALDTATDLAADALGALAAVYVITRKHPFAMLE